MDYCNPGAELDGRAVTDTTLRCSVTQGGVMGTLDHPVLPPMLYRFRPLRDEHQVRQEISAIRDQYIWCSTYRGMNDPMEGFYEPSRRLTKETRFSQLARDTYYEKRQIGICCFTDVRDNELMWSHYASNYSGICVAYNPKSLLEGLPRHAHLVRLSYGNSPPPMGVHDVRNTNEAAIRILSHKKANWVYEREWRVLAGLDRVDLQAPRCIREVYFGHRIQPHVRALLTDALGRLPIQIFEMRVSGYSHSWTKIKRVGEVIE